MQGSGHAEAVRVVYDKEKITLPFLLSMYFEAIDPTAVNHQGGDYGINYRTGIYYLDQSDLPEIEHSMKRLAERWREPIAVEVKPWKTTRRRRTITSSIWINFRAATVISTVFRWSVPPA